MAAKPLEIFIHPSLGRLLGRIKNRSLIVVDIERLAGIRPPHVAFPRQDIAPMTLQDDEPGLVSHDNHFRQNA
jgi:hypothetical protein